MRQEDAARRIAWGAVERSYVKWETTGWRATWSSGPDRETKRSAAADLAHSFTGSPRQTILN